MIEPAALSEQLIYRVGMTFPSAAPLEVPDGDRLVRALHRSARGIGVITSRRERGLYLAVLTGADDEDAACNRALRLVTAALGELGLAALAAHIELADISSQRVLPGGPHRVEAAPPLAYRSAMLPDGRVLRAACTAPLGEWFAYVEDDPVRVMAGRALPEVLPELFELPWSHEKNAQWFDDAIAELATHRTSAGVRYPCPCCDHLTQPRPPPGTNTTCEVCVWEDDRVQSRDPDHRPGANRVSLREARESYRHHGTSDIDRRALRASRAPTRRRPRSSAPSGRGRS